MYACKAYMVINNGISMYLCRLLYRYNLYHIMTSYIYVLSSLAYV